VLDFFSLAITMGTMRIALSLLISVTLGCGAAAPVATLPPVPASTDSAKLTLLESQVKRLEAALKKSSGALVAERKAAAERVKILEGKLAGGNASGSILDRAMKARFEAPPEDWRRIEGIILGDRQFPPYVYLPGELGAGLTLPYLLKTLQREFGPQLSWRDLSNPVVGAQHGVSLGGNLEILALGSWCNLYCVVASDHTPIDERDGDTLRQWILAGEVITEAASGESYDLGSNEYAQESIARVKQANNSGKPFEFERNGAPISISLSRDSLWYTARSATPPIGEGDEP
jgi:hypothetical protein